MDSQNSEILGLSFDSPTSPSITMYGLKDGTKAPGGWGFSWYPDDDPAAYVIKNPRSQKVSDMRKVLRDWDRFRSSVFLCQLSGAAKRVSQQDTQPFLVRYAGRHWLYTHTGRLSRQITNELSLGDNPFFEPVGKTTSEHAFCWMITQLKEMGVRSLLKIKGEELHKMFQTLNKYGPSDFLLSDGHVLIAYRDENGANQPLRYCRRVPPHQDSILRNETMEIEFSDPMDQSTTMVIISTQAMSAGKWIDLPPGSLIVANRGKIVFQSHENEKEVPNPVVAPPEVPDEDLVILSNEITGTFEQQIPIANQAISDPPQTLQLSQPAQNSQPSQSAQEPINPNSPVAHNEPLVSDGEFCQLQENVIANSTTSYSQSDLLEPKEGATSALVVEPVQSFEAPDTIKPRIILVTHETSYEYRNPVEYSTHRLHLKPVDDYQQDLLDYKLEISPDGQTREFDDVFGNRAVDAKITQKYKKLSIKSESRIRLYPYPLLSSTSERMTVPLVWMPWQRQMMLPYLLPPELPESELRTLTEYAMGFVKREGFDLLAALLEINRTIFTDYEYMSGSTNLQTTPFEVYTKRRGVCQDFANLFICMARLLGIPARYRVGYINTGADYENKVQSEASHAWTEMYLPWCGWYGFDPTNGCLVGHDHVRVAAGRNYRDASPTSGTIYKGGGPEKLTVAVRVRVEA